MKKSLTPVYYWLLLGCFLVGLMVIIGGITRLTQSGLSMVDWKLFMGAIPPMSEAEWLKVFEDYQAYPEYQIVNSEFTLADFKSIFWWEYIHRILGRMIGLVFIIPFLIFLLQKRLPFVLFLQLLFLLFLGGFQGFLGWFMVKSGLVNDPHVSHFRLAAHLLTAFASFGYAYWLALDIRQGPSSKLFHARLHFLAFGLIIIQIIYGAFVAGLKAGYFYNTWPLMGGQFVPDEVFQSVSREGISALIYNITDVQFIHRTLAILVVLIALYLWYLAKGGRSRRRSYSVFFFVVAFQFVLGVLTLIMNVPIALGVLHQFGALALFASYIYILHGPSSQDTIA